MKSVTSNLKNIWDEFNPEEPFTYRLFEDTYSDQYDAERQTGIFYTIFAFIAICLSAMGLLGLSIFVASRRIKEIGIRKVNGASNMKILALLSKDFMKWIGVAYLLGIPVAWIIMKNWLQEFAYRTSIQWPEFVLTAIVIISISLLIIGQVTWKIATKNPIESLRYE